MTVACMIVLEVCIIFFILDVPVCCVNYRTVINYLQNNLFY